MLDMWCSDIEALSGPTTLILVRSVGPTLFGKTVYNTENVIYLQKIHIFGTIVFVAIFAETNLLN